MRKLTSLVLATAGFLAAAPRAHAFCGFYVNSGGSEMWNDATQVVLMRSGTRTVLSMQNNYKGPPEAFAMVIPVPTVLQEGDVKTLPPEVFAHVDKMGAPRLVEYWEQDPCFQPKYEEEDLRLRRMAPSGAAAAAEDRPRDLGVTIEAKFVVGEYQIVILSAKDAAGLDTWLRQEHYQIPPGAEPFLRPYVESGMKFFVAKVDPAKVKFVDGRAALSPLRFHYDSDEFNLPIRLGLANSSGTQDLIVSILGPGQRYEVANYGNVTIPTNLDVKDAVRDKFGEFYAALFDRTVEKNPGAVVTEYAWQATNCDPCPGPVIDMSELSTLGLDVLGGDKGKAAPYTGDAMSMVLTRLHARYGKSISEDLVFKAAEPIVGGREFVVDQATHKLEERSRPDSINNFQARYAIRHEWTGPITCKDPIRGRWGGPPSGVAGGGVKPALDLAFAPRGAAKLPELVQKDIPEIDVKATAVAAAPPTAGSGTAAPPADTGPNAAAPPAPPAKKKSGCGCDTDGHGSAGALAGAAAVGLLLARRRRR